MKYIYLFMFISIAIPVTMNAQEYKSGEVIVSFHDKSTEIFNYSGSAFNCVYPTINNFLKNNNIINAMELHHGPRGVRNIYLFKFNEDINIPSMVEILKSFPEVKSASPNYKAHYEAESNDWYYNNHWWIQDWWDLGWPDPDFPDTVLCQDQWHLQKMQMNKAWNIEKGDSAVTIAIIDTGVDYLHPDLKQNIWVNPWEDLDGDGVVWDPDDFDGEDSDDPDTLVDDVIGWNFIKNNNDPYPDTSAGSYQHGTMMSSACAVTNNDGSQSDTSIAGMTWHCKIVPITGGYASLVVPAINYCINMDFDILNMSFTFPGSPSGLAEVVQKADSCGIVQVAAVGGILYVPPLLGYPAALPEVIAVAAVDENGTKLGTSGYGSHVDICGLGANITPRRMAITTLDMIISISLDQ